MGEPETAVDAHQHCWQLARFEYQWHRQVNEPVLNRDYLPEEVLPQMEEVGVRYSVLIQADSSLDETAWLLTLAARYPHIKGVVGWVDLRAPDLDEILARLQEQPLFKGVRPTLSPEQDWEQLRPGLNILAAQGLSCDLLIDGATLERAIALIAAQERTQFVIDHLAGLPLVPDGVQAWQERLAPLAAQPNVVMKFSAYVSLAEPPPLRPETLQTYVEAALALFDADRLLFASDWPVSTLSASYIEGVRLLHMATASLSAYERAQLWRETARRLYRLDL